MSRQIWPASAVLILALTVFTGCSSLRQGTPISPEPITRAQLKTRADVIQAWGIPENVRWYQGHRFYTYIFARGEGGGVGLGTALASFMFGHMHKKTDSVVVEMDENDRVVKIYTSFGSDEIAYSPFPFGE